MSVWEEEMEVQVKHILHRYSMYMSEWTEMEKMQAMCEAKLDCCRTRQRLESNDHDPDLENLGLIVKIET